MELPACPVLSGMTPWLVCGLRAPLWIPGDVIVEWLSLVRRINHLYCFYYGTNFSDNCIYALGGFDSTNYQSSVERLDPRMGKWLSVPSMTSRRSSCGVSAMDSLLYCIGGNDGTMCLCMHNRRKLIQNIFFLFQLREKDSARDGTHGRQFPICTVEGQPMKSAKLMECFMLWVAMTDHPVWTLWR